MVLRPSTAAGRDGLAELVRAPGQALLAFDYDGTLAQIVADPAQARPHPDVIAALARLAEVVQLVAVVTGRPARVAVELAELATTPGLTSLVVLGHYGMERWDAATDTVRSADPPPGLDVVRSRLPELLEAFGLADAGVEDKGLSVAVHVRRLPDPGAAFGALDQPLRALAAEAGLVAEPGKFVLELRPPGMDKGKALTALAVEAQARTLVFTGDDLGDLPAYDAVDTWRREGRPGLLVCSGSAEETALVERADVVVDGPEGVAGLCDELYALLTRRDGPGGGPPDG